MTQGLPLNFDRYGDRSDKPKKKSYSSKKRDRGTSSNGKSSEGKSDYAQRKSKERKKA